MNFLSLNSVLEDISDFVNKCLGPLGNDGTDSVKMIGYARDFFIQLFATLIIFLLVRFLIWNPVTKMLEAKREAADKELDEAKALKNSALEIETQLKKQMQDAQLEVKAMLDSAEMDANQRRELIIKEAKEEAKRRIDNANAQIEQDIKNKQSEIQQMIVSTAFEAASKILEHEVDKEKYLKVVNDIIEGANK